MLLAFHSQAHIHCSYILQLLTILNWSFFSDSSRAFGTRIEIEGKKNKFMLKMSSKNASCQNKCPSKSGKLTAIAVKVSQEKSEDANDPSLSGNENKSEKGTGPIGIEASQLYVYFENKNTCNRSEKSNFNTE